MNRSFLGHSTSNLDDVYLSCSNKGPTKIPLYTVTL